MQTIMQTLIGSIKDAEVSLIIMEIMIFNSLLYKIFETKQNKKHTVMTETHCDDGNTQ